MGFLRIEGVRRFAFFSTVPEKLEEATKLLGFDNSTGTDELPDGIFIDTPYWISDIWPIIRDGNFIYFRVVNGELRALDEPVTIHGRTLVPKRVDSLKNREIQGDINLPESFPKRIISEQR